MKVEFKERTFEKFFDYEMSILAGRPPFAVDPVDEYYYGFDSAFYIQPLSILWRWLVHHHTPNYYFPLNELYTVGMGLSLRELDKLPNYLSSPPPNFLLNLFLQYKRPEYLKHPNATEWTYHNKPYYRYSLAVGNIDPMHQHQALRALKNRAGRRAEVFYVAPAFYTIKMLLELSQNIRLIGSSHLASIDKIKPKHETITYTGAHNGFKMHSEPVDASNEEIKKVLESLRERYDGDDKVLDHEIIGDGEPLPFNRHVKNLGNIINESLFTVTDEQPGLIAQKKFISTRSVILSLFDEKPEDYKFDKERFSHSLITIISYCETFNVEVFMVKS